MKRIITELSVLDVVPIWKINKNRDYLRDRLNLDYDEISRKAFELGLKIIYMDSREDKFVDVVIVLMHEQERDSYKALILDNIITAHSHVIHNMIFLN